MPRKRRRSRLIPSISDAERVAILAGLREEPRPAGTNLADYWAGCFPRRDDRRWQKVLVVFRELSHTERHEIIRRRRDGMKGRMWINRETGRVRVHGDFPPRKWDPSDPRLVLGVTDG